VLLFRVLVGIGSSGHGALGCWGFVGGALASVYPTSLAFQLHLWFCRIIIFSGIVLVLGAVGLRVCFVAGCCVLCYRLLHALQFKFEAERKSALSHWPCWPLLHWQRLSLYQ
jgi:hypothetical protein